MQRWFHADGDGNRDADGNPDPDTDGNPDGDAHAYGNGNAADDHTYRDANDRTVADTDANANAMRHWFAAADAYTHGNAMRRWSAADAYTDGDSDSHANPNTNDYADAYTHGNADVYTDSTAYTDGLANPTTNDYADAYTDGDSANPNTNDYADAYTDTAYTDGDSDGHANPNTNDYADAYTDADNNVIASARRSGDAGRSTLEEVRGCWRRTDRVPGVPPFPDNLEPASGPAGVSQQPLAPQADRADHTLPGAVSVVDRQREPTGRRPPASAPTRHSEPQRRI